MRWRPPGSTPSASAAQGLCRRPDPRLRAPARSTQRQHVRQDQRHQRGPCRGRSRRQDRLILDAGPALSAWNRPSSRSRTARSAAAARAVCRPRSSASPAETAAPGRRRRPSRRRACLPRIMRPAQRFGSMRPTSRTGEALIAFGARSRAGSDTPGSCSTSARTAILPKRPPSHRRRQIRHHRSGRRAPIRHRGSQPVFRHLAAGAAPGLDRRSRRDLQARHRDPHRTGAARRQYRARRRPDALWRRGRAVDAPDGQGARSGHLVQHHDGGSRPRAEVAQQRAAEADRLFPLSLGSEGSCTIGGNLSSNAGGTTALAYGVAREMASASKWCWPTAAFSMACPS
jgi:hypothetical protein